MLRNTTKIRQFPWSEDENQMILAHVQTYGTRKWQICAEILNLNFFSGEAIRSPR
jgi:hypothetical protein